MKRGLSLFSSLCYSGTWLCENHFAIALSKLLVSCWILKWFPYLPRKKKMSICIIWHYLYLPKVALQQYYLLQICSYYLLSCCLNCQQHEDGKHHTVHLVCPMKTETKSTTDSQATVSYVTSDFLTVLLTVSSLLSFIMDTS